MLCGGITAFSPLMQHGAGPGKRVGIIGVGGLGHFGIMGAAALGCEKVVAISRHSTKKADALKMGATDFIATDEDKDWATGPHAGTLDIIVSTISSPKMPLPQYLNLLRTSYHAPSLLCCIHADPRTRLQGQIRAGRRPGRQHWRIQRLHSSLEEVRLQWLSVYSASY